MLSMVLSLCCVVPATATEATEAEVIRTYFVNDTFDADLGEWVLGEHSTKNTGSLTWDENGYMVLTRDTTAGDSFHNDEIRAEREFDDIVIAHFLYGLL